MRILDRFLNRLPTVTIREGHRVTVYLTADLARPPIATTRDVPVTKKVLVLVLVAPVAVSCRRAPSGSSSTRPTTGPRLERLAGLQQQYTQIVRTYQQIRAQYEYWIRMARGVRWTCSPIQGPRAVLAVTVGEGHLPHAGWLDHDGQHRRRRHGRLPPGHPSAAATTAPPGVCRPRSRPAPRPLRQAELLDASSARGSRPSAGSVRGPSMQADRPRAWRTTRSRAPTT